MKCFPSIMQCITNHAFFEIREGEEGGSPDADTSHGYVS